MKKTVIWMLMIFFVLAIPARAAFPQVGAKGAAVYDCSTERFLYTQNADQKLSIASTTKIMTAIISIEHLEMEKIITVTREHLTHGSSMYLKLGEKIYVRDLLFGLMLMSGNDAALALAHSFPGGYAEFIEEMNLLAAKLGLEESSFANPNGLEEEGHYSSARDLALLTAYAMKNPVFRGIVGTKTAAVAGRSMTNHNKLLFSIEGATGVKTGYTKAAGRCLVSSVLRGGREVIVVTLGCGDDWKVHQALHESAFAQYKETEVISEGEEVACIPVIGGVPSKIPVVSMEGVTLALKEGEAVERVLYLPKFVYAEVHAGEQAGSLVLLLEGREWRRVPLFFVSDSHLNVEPLGFWEKIPLFFKNLVR